MFSSINFLFLTSLAITSWIILCYFKQIEEQRMEDTHEHFTMERSFEEPTMRACRENSDIYLNFLCIFACIYALAKITHMTENYIAKQVHSKFLTRSPSIMPKNAYETDMRILEECKAQQEALRKQINSLKLSNSSLEKQLQESREQLEHQLRESQVQLEQQLQELQKKSRVFVMGNKLADDDYDEDEDKENKALAVANSKKSIGTSTSTSSGIANNISNSNNNNNNRNIFISNRHFHVNRQVYVNEGNVKLQMPEYRKDPGGFSQIWSKYLEMQKYAIKSPSARSPRAIAMPIVVSTEQLQSIQGLY